MRELRFGIVAFGGAGRAHTRRLDRIQGVKVTNIYDPKLSKITDIDYGEYRHIDFTESLDHFLSSDIDAVTICSPDHTHFFYAKQTVERGIHTLVEKPMFVSSSECAQMAKLLRSHRVVFGVHHQKRYIPTFLIAREYVRQRKLGDVVAIEVDYIHSMKSRATAYDDWRIDPINPQNVVLGAMSHSFDLINWILDEQPKTLFSMAGHEGWKDYPENDTNMTILQYGSGVIAKACSTISSSGFQKERLAIYGTEGQIHNNLFIDSLCKSHLIVKPKESLGIKQRLFSPILKYTNPAEYPYSINEHDRACQDLLNEFVRCIRTDSSFSVCFSSSHQVISLCLKAIKSYRTGKTIDLKTL